MRKNCITDEDEFNFFKQIESNSIKMDSYKVNKGLDMDFIHKVFDYTKEEGHTDYTMNWLILSTSGIHGSYTTLDTLENDNGLDEDSLWKNDIATITAMIIQPRRCCIAYEGEMEIKRSDIPYLRTIVMKTLNGIVDSQLHNLPRQKSVPYYIHCNGCKYQMDYHDCDDVDSYHGQYYCNLTDDDITEYVNFVETPPENCPMMKSN